MIIRGTPTELELYMLVDDSLELILNENDFYLKYIDSNGLYFLKSKDLVEFMERRVG